tara:strand:- start:131 stop:1519 length:1389 start_codon:yes stop_codon:yes gene_type:complete
MPFKYLNKLIFLKSDPIKKVIRMFNELAQYTERSGFAIIVNSKKVCVGVLTDGDIRRKFLEGLLITDPVEKFLDKKFSYAFENESTHSILRSFDKKIRILPILNVKKEPVDLIFFSDFKAGHRFRDKIIRSRVPVRISYSGGGTDMSYFMDHKSGLVLSSTISKYCYASILIRSDKEINIHSKDLSCSYSAKNINEIKYGDKLDLIKAAVKIMEPHFGFDLETSSDIEIGTGLGGSSAMSVAVIGLLNEFNNEKKLDLYDIADLAYQAERIYLNISGGWQDQYSTAFGGFNWIEFRNDDVLVNPLRIKKEIILELQFNMMLVRFGSSHESGKLEENKKAEFKLEDSNKMKKYDLMLNIAIQMKEELLKGNLKSFGDLLNESWIIKKKFSNTSNKYIDKLYSIALKNGALGGKVLGSGQSGYLLLYVSPKYQIKIKKEFKKIGLSTEKINYSSNGLEIWKTKR